MDKQNFESRLMKLTTVDEVKALCAEAGFDCTDEDAKQLLEKTKISPDELESLSGGAQRKEVLNCSFCHTRSSKDSGCAATVEEGSDCWGTDGGCMVCNINYID